MVREKRLGWRLVAATGAFALLATACGGGTDDPETDPTTDDGADDGEAAPDGDNYCEGATETDIVWAHEQEPPDMHLDDPANNLSATSWIQQGILEGLYGISSEITFVPELLAEEGVVDENDDGSATYNFTLRDDIQFSDGEPITGETVQQNFELFVSEEFSLSSKPDYQLIDPDSWEVDGQTFSYSTAEFFAGWPSLFARIYPTHVIGTDGAEANEILREWTVDGEPLPASGPLQFSQWNRGVDMQLVRNDEYHGANPDNPDVTNTGIACITGVTIQYVTETDAQINAVRSGEADFIFTQPQVAFGEGLADDPNVTTASGASAAYEHWSMNIHNPHLSDPDVREALAYAIDKGVVMETLYEPLYGDLLPLEGLGAVYWLTGSPYYEDLQGEQGYGEGDFDSANALLEGAGYEENSDGIWEHPERGPLSLRIATTGGNQLRELQQQLLQDQLGEGGWDIQIDNAPGADHFSQQAFSPGNVACSVTQGDDGATVTLASGDEATADCDVVDIVQFAWVGGPWPGSGHIAWQTGSENNPHGYANSDLDALLDQCDATIDDDERAACYVDGDRYVTTRTVDDEGLIIIPLTVKPNFFAYSDLNLQDGAVAVDANDAGPLVHAVDYLPN